MEGHADWRAHADFMNGLVAEGFVLLAGPLEGTDDALLIVRGESVEDVKRRLAGDVWVAKGL